MFIRKITNENSNVPGFSNEAGFKNIVCCCGGEVAEGKICPFQYLH